jgi:hypothetical protein
MIIGLGHQAQVGKDTAAAILVEKYGFERLAFADTLKEMALAINPVVFVHKATGPAEEPGTITLERLDEFVAAGWETAKLMPEVRRFLQNLGVAARDHLGEDVWVTPIIEKIANVASNRDFVISDVRFPNEFDRLAEWGAWMVKLTRPGAGAGNHISETALADADWNLIIENDGTLDDLENELLSLLRRAA